MSLIVFDTETTALEPGQICQLAWLSVDGARVTGANEFFAVDSLTPRALAVHGLTRERLEDLSGGRRFADRAPRLFSAFSACDCLAGHNVAFDMRFLRAEFARCGLDLGEKPLFCTRDFSVRLEREKYGRRIPWPSLSRLTGRYGLAPETVAARAAEWFSCASPAPHDARYDAAAVLLTLREACRRGDLPPDAFGREDLCGISQL